MKTYIKRETPSCVFNKGVECDCHLESDHKCQKCGWNPEVMAARKNELYQRMGLS